MNEGGLLVAQSGGHIASHAEIGILVNRTGNEAGHVQFAAEGDVKGRGEGGGGLHGGERALADVVRHREAKNCTSLEQKIQILDQQHDVNAITVPGCKW